MQTLRKTTECSLYEVARGETTQPRIIIASTPESRAICNDPFVTGYRYTSSLSAASEKVLAELRTLDLLNLPEKDTAILHILRGGLNFGLRDAVAKAWGWNDHASAFVSAQRARSSTNPNDWVITEDAYRKIHLHGQNHIIFGDVVATGTSLTYALRSLGQLAKETKAEINSVTFFTIGSPHSHLILDKVDAEYRQLFKNYQGSFVIYFEGIFAMATASSPLSIKIDGTDLLRTKSTLAPEFFDSQYADPAYPLERCTIYDAGSRAFDLHEYLEDVEDYWTKTLKLTESGMTFGKLLGERFPELSLEKFRKSGKEPDLVKIAQHQIERVRSCLN